MKLINTLQINDVIILIKRYTIKLAYQIKNFIKSDHEFTNSIKSFINEIINYITIRYPKSIDLATKTIIDQIKCKITS